MNKIQRKLYVQLLIKREEERLALEKLKEVTGFKGFEAYARCVYSTFKSESEVGTLEYHKKLLEDIEKEPDFKKEPTPEQKKAALEHILSKIERELAFTAYEASTLENCFEKVIEQELGLSNDNKELSKSYVLYKKTEICRALLKEIA